MIDCDIMYADYAYPKLYFVKEFNFREQEARIRNLEKQAQDDDKKDNEIVIRVAGCSSEYCE